MTDTSDDDKFVPTAVVDLDGTLAEYNGWKGPDVFGSPIPGALDALRDLKRMGFRVIVFTTRGDVAAVTQWLNYNGFPFDGVNTTEHNPSGCSHKPIANVYFDDRDAHVVGRKPYNWKRAMRRVRRAYHKEQQMYWDMHEAGCG